MLFTKTDNKRYVDMCAEFDKEFWIEPRNDYKLFKYLYLLFYMYACKGSYFKKFEDFDEYAQFAATIIYMRFLKKFKKGEKVKSVKNYIDKTKRFLKIMYQNQEFNLVLNAELQNIDIASFREEIKQNVQSDYNIGLKEDVTETLQTISQKVKESIEETHFNNDKLLCHRLYLSCMLTLLNSIVLPNQTIKELKTRKRTVNEKRLLEALTEERDKDAILWKLSSSYSNIVKMLVNTVRKEISEVINSTRQSYLLEDDVIESILSSAYTEDIRNDYGDTYYE